MKDLEKYCWKNVYVMYIAFVNSVMFFLHIKFFMLRALVSVNIRWLVMWGIIWSVNPYTYVGKTQQELYNRGCVSRIANYVTNSTAFGIMYSTWNSCFDFLYNYYWGLYYYTQRIQQDTVMNLHWSSWKVPVILSSFNQAWVW